MPFFEVIQFNAHRMCLTANGTGIDLSQVPVPFNRLLNAFLSTFFTLVFACHETVPRGFEPPSPGSNPVWLPTTLRDSILSMSPVTPGKVN